MTPWVQRGSEACLAEYFQRIGEVPGSPVELGLQIIPVGPAEQAAERRPCVPISGIPGRPAAFTVLYFGNGVQQSLRRPICLTVWQRALALKGVK